MFKEAGMLAPHEDIAHSFTQTIASHRHKVLAAKGKGKQRKLRVAVMFSGGPASGGHNVLLGIQHALRGSTLLGVHGGPGGFLKGDLSPIGKIDRLKDTGGFDYLGTDRTKISSVAQLMQARWQCEKHQLDAIIIIGGDDSNTNAALLAEYLAGRTQVIGVPKTMDGDVRKEPWLPITFGFDTAASTYAMLVSNLLKDTASAKKYWHFVRLMGRDASHVTLETALRTHPHHAIIAEEARWEHKTLQHIVGEIAQLISDRRAAGKDHGVVLIPEGLLQAIPEVHAMLHELGLLMAEHKLKLRRHNVIWRLAFLSRRLSRPHRRLLREFPEDIKARLVLDRDAHGNINVAWVRTEELLIQLVQQELGEPLDAMGHFYGYEGRCAPPTRFDADLAYHFGLVAGSLVADGKTGYLAAGRLEKSFTPFAIPLTGLIRRELRDGKRRLVIGKRLVRKDDDAFLAFARDRASWRLADGIVYANKDVPPLTL